MRNPDALRFVGECHCEGAAAVHVDAALASLTCGDGLHLVDVSDPAQPRRLSTLVPDGAASWGPLAGVGTTRFLGDGAGVSVMDVSDPAAPFVRSRLRTAWRVLDVAVAPGRLVAAARQAGVYQWSL